MSSYAHEQSQHDDFLTRDEETSKSPANNEDAQEKELLTKIWVEQQLAQTVEHGNMRGVKGGKERRNHLIKSVLDKADDNENRYLYINGSTSHCTHESKLLSNPDVNKDILLTERRLKEQDGSAPYIDSQAKSELSGIVIPNKMEDMHMRKEILKLPLLPRSPLISPNNSPCASPRSSFFGGSDSSPTSSPTASPAQSPGLRLVNSLPKNFIQYKERYNDNAVRGTRSLPGSPVIRRSLRGRSSDLSDTSLRKQVSFERDANGGDTIASYQITESLNGTLPSPDNKDQMPLRTNSRLISKRPGTPVTRDLMPGLRVSQMSRSMSDLVAITEKPIGSHRKRENCGLLPNILCNK